MLPCEAKAPVSRARGLRTRAPTRCEHPTRCRAACGCSCGALPRTRGAVATRIPSSCSGATSSCSTRCPGALGLGSRLSSSRSQTSTAVGWYNCTRAHRQRLRPTRLISYLRCPPRSPVIMSRLSFQRTANLLSSLYYALLRGARSGPTRRVAVKFDLVTEQDTKCNLLPVSTSCISATTNRGPWVALRKPASTVFHLRASVYPNIRVSRCSPRRSVQQRTSMHCVVAFATVSAKARYAGASACTGILSQKGRLRSQ